MVHTKLPYKKFYDSTHPLDCIVSCWP